MKIIYFLVITLVALSGTQVSFGQQSSKDDTAGVIIHADSRLDIVLAALKPKASSGSRAGVIRSGRGFRVQIYNGNDRIKATQTKVDFMRRFPSVRTYMTYIQPQYRVKAGDFKTRAEARKLYEQLSTLYSPVMIVPDIIVINTLRDD
jgi:hypothetical protein